MIKRANHIGMSVSNLERSVRFYCEGLGMDVVTQGAFERDTECGKYEQILALPGATGRVAMLQAAALQLELFEFSFPVAQPKTTPRRVCDHGITHFCIEVDDIDAEYERLRVAGASFHCPPLLFSGGVKATYVRDPDGNIFELIELPTNNENADARR